ncbi:MAG: elongation factor EF-2, partial [Nanoarchaeota archaeon]|nr:elongation factor EF-2 [Nanoarchaeota archaeon]
LRVRKKDDVVVKKLMELGQETKESKNYRDIYKGNVLIDNTRGIVQINEVIELIIDAFRQVCDAGPLAREPCISMKVRLHDCKLHEDAIHRGPAQVLPAIRSGIKEAMALAGSVLYEPIQTIQIEAPVDYMGNISKLIQNKRGQLLDMTQEGEHIVVKAKLPVGEMFGLSNDLRSCTEGRGAYFVVDQVFEKLPHDLQAKIVKQIRERKGLSENE